MVSLQQNIYYALPILKRDGNVCEDGIMSKELYLPNEEVIPGEGWFHDDNRTDYTISLLNRALN